MGEGGGPLFLGSFLRSINTHTLTLTFFLLFPL